VEERSGDRCAVIDEGSSESDFAAGPGPSISGWEWRRPATRGGVLMCFGSTRQSSNGARTVLSSAAAELSAGSVAACDAMYLLAELGGPQPGPTSMFIDDRATVVLVRDPQASQAHRAPPRPALPSRVRRERRPARSGPSTTSRTFSLPPKKFTLFRASMNLSTDTLA